MTFTAIDAFCGAGGLSIGLKAAGFNVLAGFDNDPVCIQTLLHNKSHIRHPCIESDIREMLGGRLLRFADIKCGELDLLAGGPPCQGFSIQRTIGDDKDERNLLIHDYGDLIRELMPRYFLLENVPGIGGKRGKEILAIFLKHASDLGYRVFDTVLDAQHYGVPQRRRRYVVVGERKEGDSPSTFCWPDPSSYPPPTVRDAIGALPSPPSDGSEHPSIPNHRADRLSALNRERLKALSPGQGRTDLPAHLLAPCHRVSAEITGHRNVYGRMAWDEVAPTITARFDSFTRGKFGHPREIRSISLREGAALQTFPDTYRFLGTKVQVARQIGNAVPPLFAQALGHALIAALIKHKKQ